MNAAMLQLLQAQTTVEYFDRAPLPLGRNKWVRLFRSLGNTAGLFWGYSRACARLKSGTLYLALSGGAGQWVDLAYCVVARVSGLKIFIHHHSFAYLNARQASTAALAKLVPAAQHIALCPCMGKKLQQRYAISPEQVHVMSNLALLSAPQNATILPDAPFQQAARQPVQVGFLSNITAEKGIFEFFAALDELDAQGLAYEATVAGPVDPGIESRFRAALGRAPLARHVGPIYGAAKEKFLAGIDVLLFPTRYLNEAEPVTLLEAMQAGVQVVAIDRGCIGGMISPDAGAAVPAGLFIKTACEFVAALADRDPGQRQEGRQHLKATMAHAVAAASEKRQQLFHAMSAV